MNTNGCAKGSAAVVAILSVLMTAPVFGQMYEKPYHVLLFGEVDYREISGEGDDGFMIGQSVLHLSAQIDDRLSVMSELTATARQDEDFEFEVERLVARYDFSDAFKLSAGRYHTPVGYWNTAFHHGSWLQTTVSRPETFKFGSNVVPIHFVGALLEGKILESDFGYAVGYGNGRSEEINDPGDLGDDNGDPGWVGNFYYRPVDKWRMDTGISVYVDTATPETGPEADEVILNGYFTLGGETPEVIVEYTYADHQRTDTPGPDGQTNSVYGQLAYRLWGRAENFKPYARVENLDVDDDDPLLGPLGLDYEGVAAGVRWDFSPFAALKAEFRNEQFDNGNTDQSFWLQFSFVFDPALRYGGPMTQPARVSAPMATH